MGEQPAASIHQQQDGEAASPVLNSQNEGAIEDKETQQQKSNEKTQLLATATQNSVRYGETKDGDESNPSLQSPSVVDSGHVEFSVEPIKDHLVCSLCDGLYREPFTTIKCFHTFCKSCLATAMHSSWKTKHYNCCPECETYFGRQNGLTDIALPDRVLETLIDKVLFPGLASGDKVLEDAFYRRRGIDRKTIATLRKDHNNDMKRQRQGDVIETFKLVPDASSAMAPLAQPFLQSQGSIRIGQLKKYLSKVHSAASATNDNGGASGKAASSTSSQSRLPRVETSLDIDILCNSIPLGNELSVTFVARTVWNDPVKELTLAYCEKSV